MGFSPLSALVMVTRLGDIGTSILLYLLKKIGLLSRNQLLNKDSGFLGMFGSGMAIYVMLSKGLMKLRKGLSSSPLT